MKEVGIKASRRRVRPGNGILFAATIILAVPGSRILCDYIRI